jgi:hypothetical protein
MVVAAATELQRRSPGAFLRLLEAVRRVWAQLPGSPYHALEQERIVRFLNALEEERTIG